MSTEYSCCRCGEKAKDITTWMKHRPTGTVTCPTCWENKRAGARAPSQSEDPKTFFDKYQFTMTIEKPHPTHKDQMRFEGLEADYVSRLEQQVRDLEKYVGIQNDKIDFLMSQEIHKWKRANAEKDK